MIEYILSKYNYWIYIVLMMIGFYAMISKRNLMKKLIGMTIFQTAIMLFYISIGAKRDATIPIVPEHFPEAVKALEYINPLPHVLMLTAIVVMVSTSGVALALLIMIYRKYKTIEEDEIFEIQGRSGV